MKLIPLLLVCATVFCLGYCFDITGPIDSVISSNYTLDGDTIDVVKIGTKQSQVYFSAFTAAGEKDWKLYGMTTDIELGTSVTEEILTLDGTEQRSIVKTTVLDTDLILISWYKWTVPAALESIVYQTSTGQILTDVETLYTFALDYELASYHLTPISKYIYAIALQSVVYRTRALVPSTNGLIVVHKNGTMYMEQQYYDDEWRPFGIELFSPTFSVMSLNLSCGCVHVRSFSLQGYALGKHVTFSKSQQTVSDTEATGEQNLFNVSGEPSNIMQVRTGDTSLFLYTVNNKMLATPYDLIQQAVGPETEVMSFSGSTQFMHVGAASLAPGVVAVAYDTLYLLRSVNAAFRTTVYDVEARDQRMNDVVLESNSLSGYFGVAGVDEYTHIVAFFRCNDTVDIGDCPGHMVVSHMLFRQPRPPVDMPPVTETPLGDAGTVPIAAQAPLTVTRPQANNNVSSSSVALAALGALNVLAAILLVVL